MKKIFILLFICMSLLFVGPVSAFDFEAFNSVEIHGFISQGYLQSSEYDYLGINTEDGSFEFNEMGINFTSIPSDSLMIGAQFFARDLGGLGNDGIELDWAYGDYRLNNYLGVRAGKVKIALGLYNETRDVDAVRTAIMLPNAIYVEENRDVYAGIKGFGAYGELPGGFSYQLVYGVGGVSEESNLLKDLATVLEDRLKTGTAALAEGQALASGLYTPEQAAAAGAAAASMVSVEDPSSATPHNTQNVSLQWEPRFVEGLRFGGSYLFTEIDIIMNVTTPNATLTGTNTVATVVDVETLAAVIGSIEYTRGETIVSAEYNIIRVDIGELFSTDVPTTEIHGWAVSASHRFTYWFELGAYYSDWNTNDRDRKGDDLAIKEERWMRDACLTGRFDLTENWIFKLEGHLMSGLDDVDFGNDPNPNPDWFLFASKVSYNF
jgi:hypothetical protein